MLYALQGQLDNAEALYKWVLEGYEKEEGLDAVSTLDIVNNLSLLHAARGRFDLAKVMYDRAIRSREKALGSGDPSTLVTVNNLRRLYTSQGPFDHAKAMYAQAIGVRKKKLGLDNELTLDVSNLCRNYAEKCQIDDDRAMCERALRGGEELGPEYAATFDTVDNLGKTRGRFGDDGDHVSERGAKRRRMD